ncbi:MAG: class I SAM-dependent methyltransferase [Desulfarculaceae bacterium]|jgi:ubiquinone/menaquinone biosynthesis C-methylase UbiE
MNFTTYFSKQARKPTGLFGRFFMSQVFEKGNAEVNALVMETLSPKKDDHILEIGFGTGIVLKQIADNLTGGVIEGVDFSKSMIKIAQKKNKKYINSGKVKIRTGDFDELSFPESRFDKIFTVNTIYFWKNPKATIAKISRLLKPGGKLILGFNGKDEMSEMPLDGNIFAIYSHEEIIDLLTSDGSLKDVEIKSKKGKKYTSYCAVGTK